MASHIETEATEHVAEAAEAADAGHEVAEAGAEHLAANFEGMPQLEFGAFPNQIFWMVIALLAIYFIMSKIALPRIGSVLEERHDTISGYIAQAADFKSQAEQAEADYEAALAEARSEAMRIGGEAKAEIQKDLDKAIAKADAEIGAKAAEAETAIAEIRESAVENVRVVAADTASAIVAALMPSASDDKAVASAVTERMKG
ncbi:MAG: F0F1 ATP synthase subunit B' [Rhodobacteraceae bacterium]|nr:F0F1 ATP synthase subunit B' [Paracoccaceae bacterium]